MKKFWIAYKEVSYGVIEVYAETEEEARDIAECEGDYMVNKSYIDLGEVVDVEDIDDLAQIL